MKSNKFSQNISYFVVKNSNPISNFLHSCLQYFDRTYRLKSNIQHDPLSLPLASLPSHGGGGAKKEKQFSIIKVIQYYITIATT